MAQTVEELRRQLGGTQAALNRARQHEKELQAQVDALKTQVDRLKALNGELCAEVNAKDALIRELRGE